MLGVISASLVVLLYRSMGSEALPPVSVLSVYLVGIGGGLVLARIGNLGPFEGTFGPPWFENRLHEQLIRETARAIRFGRKLTVVAAREPNNRQRINWEQHIRLCDNVIRCRDGWTIVIFPETDEEEAVAALQRVRLDASHGFEAVLVSPQPHATDPEHLALQLQTMISLVREPDTVTLHRDGEPANHSLVP